MANHLGEHMNTTIRKGKTLFYGDHSFSHGLSRSGHFTLKEAEFLESYGHTLSALANETLQPENEEEQLFVQQLALAQQAQAGQPNPLAMLAESESVKNISDARLNESKAAQNIASAQKDMVLAQKHAAEIGLTQAKTAETMKQVISPNLKNLEAILTASTNTLQ